MKRISVSLDEETHKRLKRYAALKRTTVSGAIKDWIWSQWIWGEPVYEAPVIPDKKTPDK